MRAYIGHRQLDFDAVHASAGSCMKQFRNKNVSALEVTNIYESLPIPNINMDKNV